MAERKYSPEAVRDILERALKQEEAGPGGISHQELRETARELGIDEEQLEQAVDDYEANHEIEDAREEWKRRRKEKFFDHFRSYLIVNGFLFLLDLFFSGLVWFYWPMLGWGIGLAFDAAEAFHPKKRDIDKGAQRVLAKKGVQSGAGKSRSRRFVSDGKKSLKDFVDRRDRRIEIN